VGFCDPISDQLVVVVAEALVEAVAAREEDVGDDCARRESGRREPLAERLEARSER